MLNCSRGTVYNLMAYGLPYFTLTREGDRRFDREAVLRWQGECVMLRLSNEDDLREDLELAVMEVPVR